MDPIALGNGTLNDTSEEEFYFDFHPSVILKVVEVVVLLASIAMDILVAYTLIKFKILHNEINMYILNWRICNALFLLLSPTNFVITLSLDYIPREMACSWYFIIFFLLAGNMMFITIITIDSCMSHLFGRKCFLRMRNHYKFQIILVWSVVAILCLYKSIRCVLRSLDMWTTLVMGLFMLLFLILQFIQLIRCTFICKGETTLVLILTSTYFLCWLPSFIVHAIDFIISPNIIIVIFLVAYSHSIIVFMVLYYFDLSFRVSFNSFFKSGVENDLVGSFESIDLKTEQAAV